MISHSAFWKMSRNAKKLKRIMAPMNYDLDAWRELLYINLCFIIHHYPLFIAPCKTILDWLPPYFFNALAYGLGVLTSAQLVEVHLKL